MAIDDPDLPHTNMAGAKGVQEEQSPPASPNGDTKSPKMLSLSTEAQTKTQTQADKESSSTPESPTTPLTKDEKKKKKISTSFFVEPDPETIHPDVDLTDRNNLIRLLALYQAGWELGRGRGPRDHETCIWCRGPVASNVQILTHVGTSNSCRNSWPATCLLDWINQELDIVRSPVLRCPMCREEFFSFYTQSGSDFKANQGGPDTERVINAAWVRCVLFSPVYARETCVKNGKPLIVMKGEEARKLVLLNREKVIFNGCEGLPRSGYEARKRWLERSIGWDISYTSGQIQALDSAPPDSNAAVNPSNSIEQKEEPPTPTFDTVWVLLDWGNNQFRMSPFLSLQADALKILTEEQGGTVKTMTADEFDALAKEEGGLKAAVTGFKSDDVKEMDEMATSGKDWVMRMLAESSKDGAHASDKEWYERVVQSYEIGTRQGTRHGDGNGVQVDPLEHAHLVSDGEWGVSEDSTPEDTML